ncbi:MAG: glucoamylase family protein [Verrucomicrobiota bacterium]
MMPSRTFPRALLFLLSALLVAVGCAVQKKELRPPPRAEEAVAPEEEEAEVPPPSEPAPYRGDLRPYIVSAKASSDGGSGYVAELAFDSNINSRWTSAFRDGEWVEGYFDRPVDIEQLMIRWETARASDFSVLILNPASNWVNMGNRIGGSGPLDTLTFPQPVTALGLRIQCDRRATEWGNSIFEVEVYGLTEGPPPATNLLGFVAQATPWQAYERDIARRLLAEAAGDPPTSSGMMDDAFLDLIARRAFDYFWWETTPTNGLTKDRGRNFMSSEECFVASSAAVGFALTAYAIGAEHAWVSRDDALERVRTTLNTYAHGPVRQLNGFFPHFVDIFSGADSPGTEISTIDTALFLAGMIVAMEYFQDPEISSLATGIFERVDWNWARGGNERFVSMGVDAQGNFINVVWGSFTEGILVYLLAMGSPTHALTADSWYAVNRQTGNYAGYTFLTEFGFQSIFRYQYPALWYDFRGRTDKAGIDYFENATLATLAMREYCLSKASTFLGSYGPNLWGLGAADGPGDRYMIYGFPPGEPYSPVDGTVIPYAVAGSTPFLPRHAIRALRCLYDEHHETWGKYGFADAVNPNQSFVARDVIGIDQGTILLGIENHRSQFVWRHFMKSPWIRRATAAIGWQTRPRAADPDGPIDLARDCTWRFATGGGALAAPDLDDSSWVQVLVPDYWENAGGPFANYDGPAWYRVEFNLDATRYAAWSTSGRRILLVLGAVDDIDTAYVNGFKVGETLDGDSAHLRTRRYAVPGACLKVGRNVVAVQVTDRRGSGGIWRTPVQIGPE